MQVLVTGGNGFIGQAVQRRIKEYGWQPQVADLGSCDVRDRDAVFSTMRNCDAVIHLAGMLGTHELYDTPHEAVDTNIHGTLNVLEACAEYSAAFVGITMPDVWPNVYQATKKCTRVLASGWHRDFKVPVCHVRAFNAFGPGQAYGSGHPRKIFPTFARAAWQGKSIEVYGSGGQLVDMVYVDDVAKVLVHAVEIANRGGDVTIDAATGVPQSVSQVAEMIVARVSSMGGPRSSIAHTKMRKGEVSETLLLSHREGWEHLPSECQPQSRWEDVNVSLQYYRETV